MITFTIKGHAHTYSMPMSVYDDDCKFVQLPNGDYYQIIGWLESMPPQPQLEFYAKLARPYNAIKAVAIK